MFRLFCSHPGLDKMDEIHPLKLWKAYICKPLVRYTFKASAYPVMGGEVSPKGRYLFQVMLIPISLYTVNATNHFCLFKTVIPMHNGWQMYLGYQSNLLKQTLLSTW